MNSNSKINKSKSRKLIVVNEFFKLNHKPKIGYKTFSHSYEEDKKIGKQIELHTFGILKRYYPDIEMLPDGHQMDFVVESQKIMIEVKGRGCRSDAFDTVMISKSKLDYAAQNLEYRTLILIHNVDKVIGCWRDRLRKNVNYIVKPHRRKDRNDIIDRTHLYCYILASHFKDVNLMKLGNR